MFTFLLWENSITAFISLIIIVRVTTCASIPWSKVFFLIILLPVEVRQREESLLVTFSTWKKSKCFELNNSVLNINHVISKITLKHFFVLKLMRQLFTNNHSFTILSISYYFESIVELWWCIMLELVCHKYTVMSFWDFSIINLYFLLWASEERLFFLHVFCKTYNLFAYNFEIWVQDLLL